jgi:cold shock protein
VTTSGTVVSYDEQKCWGFIRPDGAERNSKDDFVHASALEAVGLRTLEVGNRVQYELVPDKRRPTERASSI